VLNIQRLREQIEAGQTLKRTIEEMSAASLATFSAKPLFEQVAETLGAASAKRIAESSALFADISKQLTFDISDIAKQLTFDTSAFSKQLAFETSALDGLRMPMSLDPHLAGSLQGSIDQLAPLTQSFRIPDFVKDLERTRAELAALASGDRWAEMFGSSRSLVERLNLPADLANGILEFPDASTPEESRQHLVVLFSRLYALYIRVGNHDATTSLANLSQVLFLILWVISSAVAGREDFDRERLRDEIAVVRRNLETLSATCAAQQQPYPALVIHAAPVYAEANSESKRFGRVTKGTTVTVLACERRWCRVEYLHAKREQFQNGWIYNENLEAVPRDSE
jgi:hypothetical protein